MGRRSDLYVQPKLLDKRLKRKTITELTNRVLVRKEAVLPDRAVARTGRDPFHSQEMLDTLWLPRIISSAALRGAPQGWAPARR